MIVKVNEPTDWVNSLVTVKKPDGNIGVCLDPRDLNRAIKRQHFKIPTREEIMSKFADSNFFSKIDASQGFWQMALDTKSSYLTTFNTPSGCYRYLPLPYGIKSAPEIYHETIADIFEGIPGVHTDMDDVIIAGKTVKDQDRSLKEVLSGTREANFKLNKEKCQFGVSSLVFLGDMLTKNRVKPDPEKLVLLKICRLPKTKKGYKDFWA